MFYEAINPFVWKWIKGVHVLFWTDQIVFLRLRDHTVSSNIAMKINMTQNRCGIFLQAIFSLSPPNVPYLGHAGENGARGASYTFSWTLWNATHEGFEILLLIVDVWKNLLNAGLYKCWYSDTVTWIILRRNWTKFLQQILIDWLSNQSLFSEERAVMF